MWIEVYKDGEMANDQIERQERYPKKIDRQLKRWMEGWMDEALL